MPPTDLDSELVWWPWGKGDGQRKDQGGGGTSRLRRPWRAIFLVSAQALLIWGVFTLKTLENPKMAVGDLGNTTTGEKRRINYDRKLLVPVVGVERDQLRSTFGDPRGSRRHRGIDIPAPRHRPVVAVEAGKIVKITTGRLSGQAIHQISDDGQFFYFYAHLESFAIGLEEGDRVRAGEMIGTVGSSGNAQTPHLHFGIRQLDRVGEPASGHALDPFLFLRPSS